MLAELGSDTDSDGNARTRKNKKGKGKAKKRPVREPSISSLSSTDLSDDDDIPPPKPSGRKRKPQQHTLSDDDLAEAGPSSPIGNGLPHNQNHRPKKRTSPRKRRKRRKINTY